MSRTAGALGVLAVGSGILLGVGGASLVNQTTTSSCLTVTPGVYVDLPDRDQQIIDHARRAVAEDFKPRILHWDPADADAHRAASLRGIPTEPGQDRDEYPPAASAEGGAGADVAYTSPTQNRSAGSIMASQMRPYCAGQAFILEP